MNELFQLIDTDIKFSFDPEELTKNFTVRTGNIQEFADYKLEDGPQWFEIDNTKHLYLSKGFYNYCPMESEEICAKLEEIKSKLIKLPNKSRMVQIAINTPIQSKMMALYRVHDSAKVSIHIDRQRDFTINIGLKNSGRHRTVIYHNENNSDFRYPHTNPIPEELLVDHKKYSYTMNDGDAYLLNASKPHSVEPLTDTNSNAIRYIVCYTFFKSI